MLTQKISFHLIKKYKVYDLVHLSIGVVDDGEILHLTEFGSKLDYSTKCIGIRLRLDVQQSSCLTVSP